MAEFDAEELLTIQWALDKLSGEPKSKGSVQPTRKTGKYLKISLPIETEHGTRIN